MLAILNAHNFPIFQTILMILVSKCMVHRARSDKTYLSLGLLSPLSKQCSADPDEISYSLAFHQGVTVCQSTLLQVYPVHSGLTLNFIGYF